MIIALLFMSLAEILKKVSNIIILEIIMIKQNEIFQKCSLKLLYISILFGITSLATAAPIELVFSESDPSTVIGSNSLSQTSNGVTVTMRGYQVEIDSSGNETVFGPAPTSLANGQKVFNYNPRNLREPGVGFVALPDTNFNITETDLPGGGLIIPGFDTVSFSSVKTIEWMEIQFSSGVDISFIDVDDASNFNRSIWATGVAGNFDYSSGLSGAISGLNVINSQDDASDGAFRHAFSPMMDVTSLLIGSAPDFDLGAIEAQTFRSQFFITGLGFEIHDSDGGGNGGDPTTPVSTPGVLGLMVLGLLSLLGFVGRRQHRV